MINHYNNLATIKNLAIVLNDIKDEIYSYSVYKNGGYGYYAEKKLSKNKETQAEEIFNT